MGVINNLPNKTLFNNSSDGVTIGEVLIKEYPVASNQTINAGDVVDVNESGEIYSEYMKTSIGETINLPSNTAAQFITIDDNTIFASYSHITNKQSRYAIVKKINNVWTVTYDNLLVDRSTTTSTYIRYIVKMNSHRFFLSNLQQSSSSAVTNFPTDDEDNNLYCIQFNDNYTSSTVVTCTNSMPNDRSQEKFEAFNENTILQCGGYYSNNYGYTAVYTFDGTSLTCTVSPSLLTSFYCGNNQRDIIKIKENRFIVLTVGGNTTKSSIFEIKYNGSTLETSKLNVTITSNALNLRYIDESTILVHQGTTLFKIDVSGDVATLESISGYSSSYSGTFLTARNNTIYAYDTTNIYEINVDLSTNVFTINNTYNYEYFKLSEISSIEHTENGFIAFVKNVYYNLLYNIPTSNESVLYTNIIPISSECIALDSGNDGDIIRCLYSGSAELPNMKKDDTIISSGITAYCRIPGIIEVGINNNVNYVSNTLIGMPKKTAVYVVTGFKPKMIDIVYEAYNYVGNLRSIRGESKTYYSVISGSSSNGSYISITYTDDGFIFPELTYDDTVNLRYIAYY